MNNANRCANIASNRRAVGVWLAGAGLAAVALVTPPMALAETASDDRVVFEVEERSTIDTIPLRSIEEEILANTIIEGGLEAPAAGVPVQVTRDDSFYLDPLALHPNDTRTDLGRSEVPVDIRFSNPKVIPGQTHGTNYSIRPPENRTYDALNVIMVPR
ncbi:MAG TPA: hypothetical protein VFM78_06870 [Marinobacter sp.]|nr:hypothetical protein [Marinobacter sp.]